MRELKYLSNDTIRSFGHKFINLCTELNDDVNTQYMIHEFLSRLPSAMHQRFLTRCETRDQDISSFTTLEQIILIITKSENAFNNAAFITSSLHSQTSHSQS